MGDAHGPTIGAGRFRGRRLVVPPGRSVRPMRSLVRQALFDMLGPRVQGAHVLDLYSGSGALGLEALSRGARQVTFVEKDRRALAALRGNLGRCAVEPGQAAIRPADVLGLAPHGLGPFGLVLADPPFALAQALPAALEEPGVLAEDAVLAVHLPAGRAPPRLPAWVLERSRTHGRSGIHIYARSV